MRKFVLTLLSPLHSPILLVLLAFIYYKWIENAITGDLGRIGQIVFSNTYRSMEQFDPEIQKQLPLSDTSELKKFYVVFMGDSFTKHGFPYYLSTIIQQTSAKFFANNIMSPEQTFVALCNSNVDLPRVVVLESVERSCIQQLCALDFSMKVPIEPSKKENADEKQTDFSTFYRNQLFDNHSVRHLQLNRDFFSCPKKERDLYFYHEDLIFSNDHDAIIAVSKLDSLFQVARQHDVVLFYVIAADKYDVYQDYVLENEYPKKTVLDFFSVFNENLFFVNTKTLLVEKANLGIKDLYYADDTHWSPVGEKIVAEEIAKHIDSVGIFQY